MNVGEYIKTLRLNRGLSQEQLGEIVGVQRAAVQKWECGKVQNLKRETIKILADYFGVSPANFVSDSFLGSAPTVTDDYTTFPVIGEVAAGYDSIALEDWEGDTVDIPDSYLKGRPKDDFFVIRVKGSSMYPQYQNGDKVLVLKTPTLDKSGDIGVIIYEDDYATLKKVEYVYGEDWLRLIPINPEYEPKLVEGEDLEHCRVIGIPKLLIREIGD